MKSKSITFLVTNELYEAIMKVKIEKIIKDGNNITTTAIMTEALELYLNGNSLPTLPQVEETIQEASPTDFLDTASFMDIEI